MNQIILLIFIFINLILAGISLDMLSHKIYYNEISFSRNQNLVTMLNKNRAQSIMNWLIAINMLVKNFPLKYLGEDMVKHIIELMSNILIRRSA